MKEKKEMQIVVTADDSKAKTSLQRLSDYLKNNFESGAKVAECDINTVKAEIKLSKLEDKIKTMKDLLKNGNLNNEEFNSWAEDIAKAETEADKLRQTLSNVDKETSTTSKSIDNLGNKVSKSLEKASKKTRKFVLSLFSVRTAWSLISRASSSYLSENENTTNKVAGAWAYLGNIVGPIIEKVVSWLQYGIAYANVFLRALTGVDFLAKSIQKSTTKTSKEMKKTLSSMEEIVNLEDNSGSVGTNPTAGLEDISNLNLNPKVVEFMEKLGNATKDVFDWSKKAWNFLEKHFGKTGAAAITGGVALILGSAISGTGLYGMLAVLTAIATVEFTELLSKLKELYDNVNKELDLERKTIAQKVAAYNYHKKEYETAETEEERAKLIDKMKSDYEAMEKIMSDSNATLETTVELAEGWKDYYDNTKTLSEQIADATKDAESRLKGIDGTIANVKLKIGADLSDAEKETTNWYTRLSYNMNNWLFNFGEKLRNFMHGKGFKAYADGGYVEKGQIFIANERGPEMIGNIGGSTAVVNNQQIVASVSQGVASAVAGVLTTQQSTSKTAQYLYLNGREIAQAMYDDLEDEQYRRNKNASIRRA